MNLLVHETPDYTAQTTKKDYLHDSRVKIPPSAKTRRRLPARARKTSPRASARRRADACRRSDNLRAGTSYTRKTQASLLDQEPLIN